MSEEAPLKEGLRNGSIRGMIGAWKELMRKRHGIEGGSRRVKDE